MPEATWDDVRRLALALPDTEETVSRGSAFWRVHGKGFVWERPLRRPDLAALGLDEQPGPVLGAKVDDEATKFALPIASLMSSSRRRTSTAIRRCWCGSAPCRCHAWARS
jgi:hypothetical protein